MMEQDPEDAGSAGSLWRLHMLRMFEQRAKEEGLAAAPEFQELLSRMAEETVLLERMWEAQKADAAQTPWWADGEYDRERADRENDAGMRCYRAGQHGEAFGRFTEAVRLCPSSAVYHANRAAAALKLGRNDMALEDARKATSRDPTYTKAHLRMAAALMQLRRPLEALHAYQQALLLSPSSTVAQAGSRLAAKQAALQRDAQRLERAAALCGDRAQLPLQGLSEAAAAEQLLASQAMLAACPSLEAAKCAVVEALILCQRFADAQAAAEELLPGVDKLYLQAEAAWRSGVLAAGAALLEQALSLSAKSAKCLQRQQFLQQLLAHDASSERAFDEGRFQESMAACSEALSTVSECACAGPRCRFLHRRASCHLALLDTESALGDCRAALALDAAHVACRELQVAVHRESGDFVLAFLAAQQLSCVAPGQPGLVKMQRELSALAQQAQHSRTGHVRHGSGHPGCPSRSTTFYEDLSIQPGSSAQEVRSAYRRLAAKWHPDKWMHASREEQAAAQQKFSSLQEAHATLCNEQRRCLYDAQIMPT